MKPFLKPRHAGPSAIELIEESVHLLRGAPSSTLALYLAGTAPFALGIVFFVAHVTWFHPASEVIAWNSLGLVALFTGMKVAHAEFCARLLAQRMGAQPAPLSVTRAWQFARSQLALQGWGVLMLPLALVITVPFPWFYAYFQSASVIGESRQLAAESRAQAALWPAQNTLGQLFLSALALAVWVNIGMAFWLVPWLANRLLGLHNLFGFSGWWIVNTTFLAATAMLTWLACDPLVKAFYTLRVFYGRSRKSAEDLRVELRRFSRRKQAGVLVVMAIGLALAAPAPVRATEQSSNQISRVDARELNAAIDRTLARSEYQWRLRPLPAEEGAVKNQGRIAKFFRAGAEWVQDLFRWLRQSLRRFGRWIADLFPDRVPDGGSSRGGVGLARMLSVIMWIFVAVIVVLLVGVGVVAWRRRHVFKQPKITAEAVAAAVPDLHDENTQAAQLPVDGWLALAREKIGQGEWRLAWRALHLATLAQLGGNGLVSLAKFKTNLDYERELRRKGAGKIETVAWFSSRSRAFEAAWYGRDAATESLAREWLAELERPAQSSMSMEGTAR